MFFRTNSSPHQNEIATRLLEILLDQTKDEVKSIEAEDNSALQTLKLLVIGYLESETHGGTTNEIMDGAKSLIEECKKYGVDPRDTVNIIRLIGHEILDHYAEAFDDAVCQIQDIRESVAEAALEAVDRATKPTETPAEEERPESREPVFEERTPVGASVDTM